MIKTDIIAFAIEVLIIAIFLKTKIFKSKK